jgi:hypothetical protein
LEVLPGKARATEAKAKSANKVLWKCILKIR